MTEATYINYGDVIATIILLGFMAVFIFLLFRVIKAFKRDVKKAEERLEKEKENKLLLEKHLDELNERVEILETKLKDLDR